MSNMYYITYKYVDVMIYHVIIIMLAQLMSVSNWTPITNMD